MPNSNRTRCHITLDPMSKYTLGPMFSSAQYIHNRANDDEKTFPLRIWAKFKPGQMSHHTTKISRKDDEFKLSIQMDEWHVSLFLRFSL